MTKSRFDWQRTAAIGAAAAALCGLALAAVALAPGPPGNRARNALATGPARTVDPAPGLGRTAGGGHDSDRQRPFDGTIQDKRITVGQRVERDQLLYTLDTAQLDVQVRQALAELLKAKRAVQDLASWESGQEVGRARRGDGAHGPGRYRTQAGRNQKPTGSRHRASHGSRRAGPAGEATAAGPGVGAGRTDKHAGARPGREPPDCRYGIDQRHRQTWRSGGCPRTAHDQGSLCRRRGERARPATAAPMAPVQVGSRVTPGQPLIGLASVEHLKAIAKVDEADVNQLREDCPWKSAAMASRALSCKEASRQWAGSPSPTTRRALAPRTWSP